MGPTSNAREGRKRGREWVGKREVKRGEEKEREGNGTGKTLW